MGSEERQVPVLDEEGRGSLRGEGHVCLAQERPLRL